MFERAVKKFLEEIQKSRQPKIYRGKQTLKQLASQNAGLANIEISDKNIRAFTHVAKKYHVDFALKKEQNNLGMLYFQGNGILQNAQEAVKWFSWFPLLQGRDRASFFAVGGGAKRGKTTVFANRRKSSFSLEFTGKSGCFSML